MGDLARAFAKVLIDEMHGRGQPPGRIEPNMGQPPSAPPPLRPPSKFGPRDAGFTGPPYARTGRHPKGAPLANAAEQGRAAVEQALSPGYKDEPVSITPATADFDTFMGKRADELATQAWRDRMKAAKEAKSAKRAGEAGEKAVAEAVQPTPEEVRDFIARMRGGGGASITPGSDMPMTPPQTPPSQWGPGEAEMYARAFGPQFVEQALRTEPAPMTPPHPVINPETISTQPQSPYEPWYVRNMGLSAVEKGLEE